MHHINRHTGITIAIVKQPRDWQRLTLTHQYHVPVRYCASIIQSSWIAWYMPGWYSSQPHCIRYVSSITDLSIMPRYAYLPDEPHHPRAQHLYGVLTLDTLYELHVPLVSQHWRRIGIHHTSWGALTRAYDLGALTRITKRMRTHVLSAGETFELFDLCMPITQTPDRTTTEHEL